MTVLLYLLFVILLSIGYYRFTNRKKLAQAAKFPGPPTMPFFGNTLAFRNRTSADIIEFFETYCGQYGGIFRVWVGNKLAFVISDAKISEIILSNSTTFLPKNDLYQFLSSWLGDGLLLSKGRKWHSRRKILTPAFHFTILEQFVEIFDKQSAVLVRQLEQFAEDGQVINIQKYVSLMALDVVCETAMGTQINAQVDTQSKYVKAVHEITTILATRFASIWQRNEFFFKLFAKEVRQNQINAIKTMHDFTEEIIQKRRQQLIEESVAEEYNDIGSRKKMALLDVLLKSTIDGKPLTNRDIQEEVDTFMFEGHDTTTAAMSFTLWLLSRNKSVQDRLYEEIKMVLGTDKHRAVTYKDLQEMKYIELVIKESMRIFPPVPVIGRKLEDEAVIDENLIIPTGSSLTINFYIMFRDAKHFPDPLVFRPERFSLENTIEQHNPYVYTPFSAGSRNCIGQKFAMLEMKSTISKVLRHYELLPAGDEPQPIMELILRSSNGIQMALKPREG